MAATCAHPIGRGRWGGSVWACASGQTTLLYDADMRTHALTAYSAHAFAARNLHLLSAIESTLDALQADTGLIVSIEHTYEEIHEMLIDAAQDLTEEGIQLCLSPVEKGSDTVSRLWRDARARHKAACNDPQLQADDGVADAWQQFMDALHSLHDKIEEVRNWLEDVGACMQPRGEQVFTDVDDMFTSIMSGS